MEEAREDAEDAVRWLRGLCEEGRFVATDAAADVTGPPDDFDAARFARGQRVAVDNLFSLAYAELVSMLMMFAFEDQTVALLATGKSDTPTKAYFRYLSTMRRVRSWYEGDIWDPESAACKNIKSVRAMHDSVARRLAAATDTCPSLHARALSPLASVDGDVGSAKTSPVDADCTAAAAARAAFAPLADRDGACPWAVADSAEPPVVNQRAMAVTQVAFLGLFILAPGCFGAHRVTEADLEALVYVWSVLGGALGVQDRYNACGGRGGASLSVARARARVVVRACALPRLARASSRWQVMSAALCDGAALAAPGLSLPLALDALADVLAVVADIGPRHMRVERRRLSVRDRAWRALYRLVLQHAMQSVTGRAFHNALFRLSLWVSEHVAEPLFLPRQCPRHPRKGHRITD